MHRVRNCVAGCPGGQQRLCVALRGTTCGGFEFEALTTIGRCGAERDAATTISSCCKVPMRCVSDRAAVMPRGEQCRVWCAGPGIVYGMYCFDLAVGDTLLYHNLLTCPQFTLYVVVLAD